MSTARDPLEWRLASIYRELDCMLMWSAQWRSLDWSYRSDVHHHWSIVLMHIDRFRWHGYLNGPIEPDWWIELQLDIEELSAVIEYMELRYPDFSKPGRW